jgi:hypothetical protein
MIRYIPVLNPSAADKLSRALWALSRPTAVQASDVTKRLFSFIAATDGTIWLQTETTATLPIHQLAELTGILEVMQPLINQGQLPASAPSNLMAVITASKGTRLNIYGILPAFFKDRSKTKEELLSLGLLKEVKL